MKATFLLIALAATTIAQDVSIFSHFYQLSANTWSKQAVFVQNNDMTANHTITNVYFEVLVAGSSASDDRLGVFYGYGNPVGVVGAVTGGANGTGYFYVFGDAGSYTVDVVATYTKYNGQVSITSQQLTFVIGGTQTAWSRDEGEALSEDELAFELVRDGSNTDLATVASSGISNLNGIAGQTTWNNYKMKCGSTKLYDVTVNYTLITGDPNTIFYWVDANASSTFNANSQYSLNFAINGPSSDGDTWTVRITFGYKKGSPSGTDGTWYINEPFYITDGTGGTGKRSISEVAINAGERGVEQGRFGMAVGAASAAVAVVVVVAAVIAVVAIRRNRQSQVVA